MAESGRLPHHSAMEEPNVIRTLTRKRDEIERSILNYEKWLDEARMDLAHVQACLRVFAADGAPADTMPYHDLGRLFRRGEIVLICKAALAAEGPLDTRELAVRVIRAKGMDEADKNLRKALAYRIVQCLTLQWKRGVLDSPEKRANVRVWAV